MKGKNRVSKYGGIRYIKETIKLSDLEARTGGVGTAKKYHCSFNDISDGNAWLGVSPQQAISTLYARYAITGCKWTFIPKFDSATTGGVKASTVLYAINRDPQDLTTTEEDLIR